MKKFILFAVFSMCFQVLFAQFETDTIYSIVNEAQATVYQKNAMHNCGFMPGLQTISVNDNVIVWRLTDTVGKVCRCDCFFDYSVTINSLNPGAYTLYVYSVNDHLHGYDTAYEGFTTFTIGGALKSDQDIKIATTTGSCHEDYSLEYKEKFSVSNQSGEIIVTSKSSSKINRLVLNNMQGFEVLNKTYGKEFEVYLPTTGLKKGVYILTVFDDRNTKISRKVVVL